jgi:hypothetical protein
MKIIALEGGSVRSRNIFGFVSFCHVVVQKRRNLNSQEKHTWRPARRDGQRVHVRGNNTELRHSWSVFARRDYWRQSCVQLSWRRSDVGRKLVGLTVRGLSFPHRLYSESKIRSDLYSAICAQDMRSKHAGHRLKWSLKLTEMKRVIAGQILVKLTVIKFQVTPCNGSVVPYVLR